MALFRVDGDHLFKGPHQGSELFKEGASLARAKAAMIMVHGRGATAPGILQLAAELAQPYFHYMAPQAQNNTWYPHSFLEPQEKNQPGIASGLQLLYDLLMSMDQAGIPKEKIFLLGFSQGACLVSEFAARHPQKLGGLVVLSGGLIGPKISIENYSGFMQGTPVFIGCSDYDPHIPQVRIDETEAVFQNLGAKVNKQIYKGMGHRIVEDEIQIIRGMMTKALNDQ